MGTRLYVLEVVQFIEEANGENGWLNLKSKQKHIGYMKAKFETKKDACSYYNKHNPHMRQLNAHNTYESDWDPHTKLMYIVRKDYSLVDSIPTFTVDDLPYQTESGITIYPYLK